jgi:hypothetical protein
MGLKKFLRNPGIDFFDKKMNLISSFLIKIKNFFIFHKWILLIKIASKDGWMRIEQPKNVSRADPFIMRKGNKYFLFFEEFDLRKRHGYISVGQLDIKNNNIINVKKILEKPYHLSFPFVFIFKKNYFMIPESHNKRAVDLYKFKEFPYKLTKIKTLLNNVDAVDSVMIFKNKYWWLFSNLRAEEKDLHSKKLCLYYSENFLKNDFAVHPKNPICIDPKYARNAGQIIEKNELFRVSQDCSSIYGESINILKIKELSKSKYLESFYANIQPPKGYIAFHTMNSIDNLTIADGKYAFFDSRLFLYRTLDYLNKKFKRIV